MPEAPADPRWHLALTAIDLLAASSSSGLGGIGGILVHARPGPVRDAFAAALAAKMAVRRLPASADAEALDGGLDLASTLAAGRPVHRAGLLTEARGGAILVPMAERLGPGLAARLATAIDDGRNAGGPSLILFDESQPDSDEYVAPALADRLAIHLDLGSIRVPLGELLNGDAAVDTVSNADPAGDAIADPATALTAAAITLGILSIRAPIMALRLAHTHATLAGRADIHAIDLETAAALVLGPRATRDPAAENQPQPDETPPENPPPPPENSDSDSESEQDSPPDQGLDMTDLVLEAASTTLPPGLLDALATGRAPKNAGGGRSGARQRSLLSGRPAGVRAGLPGRGARLALIDTIKAAAPWQRLRPATPGRLAIRRDDLRIRRFVARAETTTIFAVDASGSAAFARLSEAKGAVELLLAAAYVKRAEVALVAFRGESATLSLPPTRSLARAKRELAALAGGGGTPMAAGIDMARQVAEAERHRGRTPLIVILTDGRANVGGSPGQTPQQAALASARVLGTTGLPSVFIDCSARPRPEGGQLAAAMAARYVALPRLDAATVVAAVNAAQKATMPT
jgi:magnesium chelatase subunit D